jgi:hypothetical protein
MAWLGRRCGRASTCGSIGSIGCSGYRKMSGSTARLERLACGGEGRVLACPGRRGASGNSEVHIRVICGHDHDAALSLRLGAHDSSWEIHQLELLKFFSESVFVVPTRHGPPPAVGSPRRPAGRPPKLVLTCTVVRLRIHCHGGHLDFKRSQRRG